MTCPLISEVYRVENERFLNLKPPCKLRESSGDMSSDLRGIQGWKTDKIQWFQSKQQQ